VPARFCYRGRVGDSSPALPIAGSRIATSQGADVTSRSGTSLVAVLAALAGATGTFVLTTITMDTVPDAVLVGFSCVVAFAFSLVFLGREGLADLRRADRGILLWAAIAGAVAFWAAPLLSLSQRASDAPSGAETLFFTTTAWGVACILAATAVRIERPAVSAIGGALAALAGAAGMLASWETPSSFSPFAKFPTREALMLLAGVMFALGALVLAGVARRVGARVTTSVALGGAGGVGLLVGLVSLLAAEPIHAGGLAACLYVGVATAVFVVGWIVTVDECGLSRTSVALLAVPLAVTALSVVERFTAIYGPNPMAVPGVASGAAALAAGVVVVWLTDRAPEPGGTAEGLRRLRIPLVSAAVAVALALVALVTPALNARAEGGLEGGFDAAWTMLGFESAAGWLTVAAAALALAAVFVAARSSSVRVWAPSAAAAIVCAVATISLAGTTLHTWNTWVPADVQQTYGTEYSRLIISARLDYVRLAALLLVVVTVVALAVFSARRVARDVTQQEETG